MDRMFPASDRRFFAPEIVQTSATDCGPAALKCLLDGFGLPVDYGRLREACQTDVDGTSIDTLEDVAAQLGLVCRQVITPIDHLLMSEAALIPALVVTVLPSGATHFLVVWRVLGAFVQVMDPAGGRRWLTRQQFLQEVYRHRSAVPASAWRAWAGTEGFCTPLRARLRALGLAPAKINTLVDEATADPDWRPLASLDAATRLVTAVVAAGGLSRGAQAAKMVDQFWRQAHHAPAVGEALIPDAYWSVRPVPAPGGAATNEPQMLSMCGAVALAISGRRVDAAAATEGQQSGDGARGRAALPRDLAAAIAPQAGAARAIWNALRSDGLFTPALLVPAVLMGAFSVTLEAALFRALMVVNTWVAQPDQRMALAIGILCFSIVLFLLAGPVEVLERRLGRRVEARLRIALLAKIPRLGDRHFHSRLISDMAHRAYSLRQLHSVPSLTFNLLRQASQLLFTALGIVVIAPDSWPIVLATLGFVAAIAIAGQPLLRERDLRVRTHNSALSRFYLDALLGLVPIRAHSAERAVRREHEMLLVRWARAAQNLTSIEVILQALVAFIGIGSACWIVLRFLAGGGEASAVLLLLYWALALPALNQELVTSVQQYPMLRNHLLRLLEPLNAPDENAAVNGDQAVPALPATTQGMAIELHDVSVMAGGHPILSGINLAIAAGEHVAVVGASGAGKSSLMALLLGLNQPAAGAVLIDGEPVSSERIQALRRSTAWVDPALQLWNRTLAANLRYGLAAHEHPPLDEALALADLYDVLPMLPAGLETTLGEGGGLVAGGEGQRVRFGRALLRQGVRLAILDEPFRGLDRGQRQELLANARQHWQAATLLCITHDISETMDFGRVLVLDGGRIVEDGAPQGLAADPQSVYSALVAADAAAYHAIWADQSWRRLQLDDGQLSEQQQPASPIKEDA